MGESGCRLALLNCSLAEIPLDRRRIALGGFLIGLKAIDRPAARRNKSYAEPPGEQTARSN